MIKVQGVLSVVTVSSNLAVTYKLKECCSQSLLTHVTLTHSLQQLALHEWFDHVVGGGEVPGLVDEVHGFETCRE